MKDKSSVIDVSQSGREWRLENNWFIKSSSELTLSGKEISDSKFETKNWCPAKVPSTVLAMLIANGHEYQNPFFGLNLKNIPNERFAVPWWYRTTFFYRGVLDETFSYLYLDGINYRGNVWLNRKQVASVEQLEGPFRQFELNISDYVDEGENVLAVEVFPPQPGNFTIGFVDWNPAPPDQNIGLFRPVRLRVDEGIAVKRPFVQSKINLDTLKEAELFITTEVENHSQKKITGQLRGEFDSIIFEKEVEMNPGETKLVSFEPKNFPQLKLDRPRLWWPNNLGEANLYQLFLTFAEKEKVFARETMSFGIREISDYFNEAGHRGFCVNGKKILIKGGGWTDDIFLADTPESLEKQIQYVKHLNLNCIRLEGFWGTDHTLYDLCDKYGILMMVGWSCHWEHEHYVAKKVDGKYGGILEDKEFRFISDSFRDQVIWLRHHPSIFVWAVGSDKLPHPELEKKYVEIFKHYDPTRPYLASTAGMGSEQGIIVKVLLESEISGPTGVKMLGPYDYTPPVYWFTNKHQGGAYGFNTETGPGAQVPPLESLKKMIPQDHLWPVDEVWNFHCALLDFSKLDRFIHALDQRYGGADTVEQFAQKAQMLNYELMRPMFEAFQAHKFSATGVIQWMLNAAWPKLYWQLYDYYLMPNGAFYGAKKACQPLHLIYRYGFNDIFLANDFNYPIENLLAKIRIFDIHSQKIFEKSLALNINEIESKHIFQLPHLPNLSPTYFLDLRLYNAQGDQIDDNFYWLSTKADVLDYDARAGAWQFHTPSKEYADFTLLTNLPRVKINTAHVFQKIGTEQRISVDLENRSQQIAFFIELKVTGGTSGEPILPIFWTDNYLSLLPGEKRKVEATFFDKDVKSEKPTCKISGWNLLPEK